MLAQRVAPTGLSGNEDRIRDMSSPGTDRRDFFISFNSANRAWAEWIASELETAGYTTYFQHWDFAPGSNFVIEMHKAAAQSVRTIALLSPAYLTALFTQPEWAAALMQDPAGAKRTLVPVRVEECSPEGILAPIVYADLVGLDEGAARAKLLATAQGRRPTPASVAFPKGGSAPKREFPRVAVVEQKAPPGLEPSPEPHRDVRVPPSFLWFGLALLAAVLLIAFGNRLVGLGLVNQIHYVLLVALGLAAAVAMRRSLARYRGKSKLGDLELRGPVVVLALVIGAGMWFAPGSGSFGVTVFVEGPDAPLRQGRVALDLGPDRRVEAIGEKGAAFFSGIPAEFRGREAGVSLEPNGFERTEGGPVKLANDSKRTSKPS